MIPYSKTAKTPIIENIDVAGNVIIELIDQTTSNRVSFNNLSWTCYNNLGTDNVIDKVNLKKLPKGMYSIITKTQSVKIIVD